METTPSSNKHKNNFTISDSDLISQTEIAPSVKAGFSLCHFLMEQTIPSLQDAIISIHYIRSKISRARV